jgi:uncharacterized membrane protein SirB2
MAESRRHASRGGPDAWSHPDAAGGFAGQPRTLHWRGSPIDYLTIKFIHVTCVATSFSLFFLRGIWMLRRSALLQQRWVRVLPHVVDSVLLASAVAMAVWSRQYPLGDDWLTAKVAGLILYIGLGTVAIRRGRTRRVRIAAWLAALAVFAYIVGVALTRRPLPWSV